MDESGPADVSAPVVRVRWARVVPAGALALTPAEADRVARLRVPGTADRVASSLVLARRVVAGVLDRDPAEVVLRRRCPRCGSTTHGRPAATVAGSGTGLALSLTRTRGLVGVAVSATAGDVGLDCEHRDTAVPAGLGAVLLSTHEAATTTDGLLRTWVRKEALLKARGDGLATDPRTLVLGPATRPPRVLSWPDEPPGAADGPPTPGGSSTARGPWDLRDLDPTGDHLAALAWRPSREGTDTGPAVVDVATVDLEGDTPGPPAR